MKDTALAFVVLFSYLLSLDAAACSAFLAKTSSQFYLAKNYDWTFGQGLLLTNQRNLEKIAVVPSRSTPMRWRSKYGSLTFNQFGKEFPNGGINEKGLAIEVLWLNQSTVPSANALPAINEAQWIQYQLDVSANINELIENAQKVRVETLLAKVHYFACDASGECASLEYIDGKLVIHTGEEMPARTLTNSSYTDSFAELKNYQGFGGSRSMPARSYDSKTRFIRLAMQSQGENNGENAPIESSFLLLRDVAANGLGTRWAIVYELQSGTVHFKRFDIGSAEEKILSMANLSFDCHSTAKAFNLDRTLSGSIENSLTDYSKEENDELVEKSGTMMGAPRKLIDGAKQVPALMRCME